jgi:hypothetical protein
MWGKQMRRRKLSLVIAAVLAALTVAAVPSAAQAFGIEGVDGWLRNEAGGPEFQAGAHADFNTTIHFATTLNGLGEKTPEGNPKTIEVTLPEGLVGNPTATPKCTQGELTVLHDIADCEPSSQVGVALIGNNAFGHNGAAPVPVYNMVPPRGVAGEFAFNLFGDLVFFDSGVTAEGGYRIKTTISNTSQALALTDTGLTLWGVPASPVHDSERALQGGGLPPENPETGEPITVPVPPGTPERALLDNPSACTGQPLRTVARANSWQAPEAFSSSGFETDTGGNPMTITGCGKVTFQASMRAQPTTTQADSPTGLAVELVLPQNANAEGLSPSQLRDAVVTLPEGMAINPASAGGLGSCSPDQIGLGTDSQPSCPESSKIGTVTIETPLLEAPLLGSVYLAQQRQNKFGSLLALYIVVNDPTTGVLLKIPGKVETDPSTGRVVTRFDEAPQLPLERLQLNLFGGPRASLLTPPTCGTYSTQGEFTPWSGTAAVTSTDSFKINSGPEGQACSSGSFEPKLEAGTANPSAGAYSPFELRITRGDGSQRLSGVSVRLPRGLLAKLAGVPYCSDAALGGIPTTEGTGAAEFANPSCPAASRIGSVAVAAGAGPMPFWAKTGSAYLAGPYKGAPLSLAIVTPALAGPFDLGNVVVRVALQVNPETSQVTAVSDPLPTILQGIPLDLRTVQVQLDRSQFTLNPTNCEAQQVSATITSTGGATATPAEPFAAAGCAGLGFSPKLALSLRGGTHRGAFPALTARLAAKSGQANFRRVTVTLPHSEFLEQGHIRTVCTRVQFAAKQCPAASIYGFAEATTPLLEQPLRGPVYLRSSSHKLPDLVAALRGQIEIDLDGRIDSHDQGIRATFETLPDAPVSGFVLKMNGGKKSLLVNSTNLCSKGAKAHGLVRFIGQNGKSSQLKPLVQPQCGKGKAGKKRGK